MADNPEFELVIKRRERGRGGGVGILYRKDRVSLKQVSLPSDDGLEILACHGSAGHIKIAVISMYFPPGSNKTRDINDALSNHIHHAFSRLADPLIIAGGDLNHLDLTSALLEHTGVRPLNHLPTRGEFDSRPGFHKQDGLSEWTICKCPALR